MTDWVELAERAAARYEDGGARLPDEPDERQRQLTRMGNAAWAAGLSLLMCGRRRDAAGWLVRAAETYRESWPLAPPESWGRPIGAMKSRLIAGDVEGARADADWVLEAGATDSEGSIGRYAATLARLVRGEDDVARELAAGLVGRADFPQTVAATLAAISEQDEDRYAVSVASLVADFEGRSDFLEDIPVADTVLALQELARARDLALPLESPVLPKAEAG
jgi:hypothetical protein